MVQSHLPLSFSYIGFFRSHHDFLGHDIEGAALSLVRDDGLKEVAAVHRLPKEVAGDQQLVARLTDLEVKDLIHIFFRIQVSLGGCSYVAEHLAELLSIKLQVAVLLLLA